MTAKEIYQLQLQIDRLVLELSELKKTCVVEECKNKSIDGTEYCLIHYLEYEKKPKEEE